MRRRVTWQHLLCYMHHSHPLAAWHASIEHISYLGMAKDMHLKASNQISTVLNDVLGHA